MRLIKLECPDCGANLEIPEGHQYIFCQYCGRKILIDEEISKAEIVHIYRDEAKLKELELQEEARLREEEEKIKREERVRQEWQDYTSRKKRAFTFFLILYFTVFIGCIIHHLIFVNDTGYLIGMAASIILPALYPHKYVERPFILTYLIYWAPMFFIFYFLLSSR